MILPPGYDEMTEEEIVAAMVKAGIDRETAERNAILAKAPEGEGRFQRILD